MARRKCQPIKKSFLMMYTDPKFTENSDPDPKKIISDPQHWLGRHLFLMKYSSGIYLCIGPLSGQWKIL